MTSGSPLAVRSLPGGFAAVEVEGLTPATDAADASTRGTLRAALWEHAVLCVRLPAPLSEGDARALASMIGPVKDPVGRTRGGGLLRYSDERQIVDAGFVLTDELRAQLGDLNFGGDNLRPGLFETFHTDDTYTERPALATVLHARELPSGPGGDTKFIDMRAAYRLLDATLQDHAEQRAPRYAHSWRPHDVLIWDNASVQHEASGDFPVGQPRNFWRYMIEGPVPAATPRPG